MRTARAAMAALVAGAMTFALGGCAASTAPPAFPDEAEIAVIVAEQNAQWWESMFPGEEPPEVEVIGATSWEAQAGFVAKCISEFDIEGFSGSGTSWEFASDDPEVGDEFSRAMWICNVAYPVRDDGQVLMSDAQLSWLYDYLAERYRPCMERLGFALVGFPNRETFLDESVGFPVWFPWEDTIQPNPVGPDRVRVDELCPLPEMVDHLRP